MSFALDRVLIVMPALNEAEVIEQVIDEVKTELPAATVLVIDDGSSDGTAIIARRAGARVLVLPFNLGVGGAMRLGFKYALREGYPVVVQLDSDGQHKPADVPDLVKLLDSADVVIGARFAGAGDYEVRGPRKWAMRFLSAVLSKGTNTVLTDTTSGFKAHGPAAVDIFAREYPAEYLGDTIESLVIGHRAGLKYMQLGVQMRERVGGVPSQNPWKSTIYLSRAFFALMIAFMRPKQFREAA